MVVVLCRLNIQAGKQQEFIERTKGPLEKSRQEAGAISYDLFAQAGNDTSFVFVEEWENNDVFQKHLATEHFAEIGKILGDLAAGEPSLKIYHVDKVE